MPPTLEQGHGEQRLTVDREEIERGEDLSPPELARVGVPLVIDFEIALVLPLVDQHTVDDRRLATRVSHDRVVQLSWTLTRALVPHELRRAVADSHEEAGTHPLRLEDVAVGLRPLAGEPRTLRREIRAEERAQTSEYPALDSQNIRSIIRTLVLTRFPRPCTRGALWRSHPRSLCPSAKGSPPPHHHAARRRHPLHGGCGRACIHPSARARSCGPWPFGPRRRCSPRTLAARGGASSGHGGAELTAASLSLGAAVAPCGRVGRERCGEGGELRRNDELGRRRRA